MSHIQNYEHLKQEYDYLQAEAQKPNDNFESWRKHNQDTQNKEYFEYMMNKMMSKNFENSYNEFEMHKHMYMMYLRQKMSYEKEFLEEMEKITDAKYNRNPYDQNSYNSMYKPDKYWSESQQFYNKSGCNNNQSVGTRIVDPCKKANYSASFSTSYERNSCTRQ